MSKDESSIINTFNWDPVKEKAPTAEFVKKYLRERGLKCLTDGHIYYLDPNANTSRRSLPNLTEFGTDVYVRRVYISISRTQEVDAGTKGSPDLLEARMIKLARECQWADFFLERGREGDAYEEDFRIRIDWCEPQEEEEEETMSKSLAEFTAFNATSAATEVGAVAARKIDITEAYSVLKTEKKEGGEKSFMKVISPKEVPSRYHVAPEFNFVFDSRHHIFLVLGELSYLCTNLFKLVRMPPKLMKTSNAELEFKMPL